MQKLTEIEVALRQIDAGTFQRLCDELLFCRKGLNFQEISRSGTQIGKLKTTPGTPDTFVALPNGRYVLIEYTTRESNLFGKLNEDLDKCLDSVYTGLPLYKVESIILAFNGQLPLDKTDLLKNRCRQERVSLELINIDSLALALYSDYPHIAENYLGVPADTYQIQTPEQFIAEKQTSAVGDNNPLTNSFIGRKDDLTNLINRLAHTMVVVISGAQGVGKTRIALEAMQQYKAQVANCTAYCISNKGESLLNDLNRYIKPDRHYILLVDDANRQLNILKRTVEHLVARGNINFKVIVTVRDYALDSLLPIIDSYHWDQLSIEIFSDDEIIELIAAEPLQILNYRYQRKIITIANGNSRLAIMASLYAKKYQDLLVLEDATDLYTRFYGQLTDNEGNSLLDVPDRLKVLALLSLFKRIDLEKQEFCEQLHLAFGIDRNTLTSQLAELGQLELADMYPLDDSLYRIADQNLATYSIYQAFLNRKLLNISSLLQYFFGETDYSERIKDALFGIMHAFNTGVIIDELRLKVKTQYNVIKADEKKALHYLQTFYAVIPIQTLQYLSTFIHSALPSIDKHRSDDFFFSADEYISARLELLFAIMHTYDEHRLAVCELLIEMIRIRPSIISLILKKIHSRLSFDPDDEEYLTTRQEQFYECLKSIVDLTDENQSRLLWMIVGFFLNTVFESQRFKSQVLTITTYPLPAETPFIDFRNKLWMFLTEHFPDNIELGKQLLLGYIGQRPKENPSLIIFDRPFVIALIKKFLSPDSFVDCNTVHAYSRRLEWESAKSDEIITLTEQFQNPIFKLYHALDWDYTYGMPTWDERYDNEEVYKKRKGDELQQAVPLNNERDVVHFLDNLFFLYQQPAVVNQLSVESIGMRLAILNQQNPVLLKQTIEAMTQREWPANFSIRFILATIFSVGISPAKEWYPIFNKASFQRNEWIYEFYNQLAESEINVEYADKLVAWYNSEASDGITIQTYFWKKYLVYRPSLFRDIMLILADKCTYEGKLYYWWSHLIDEDYIQFISDDLPLLKRIYIQQIAIVQNQSFDYTGTDLKFLLTYEPDFLVEYVEKYLEKSDSWNPVIPNIDIVWQFDNAIERIMVLVASPATKKHEGLRNSLYEALLRHLHDEKKIGLFLAEFVNEYATNTSMIDQMIQIVIKQKPLYYETVLQYFLNANQSIEAFKSIALCPSSLSGGRNTNFNEIRANWHKRALEAVKSMPQKILFLDHQDYLEEQIMRFERGAESERRHQFMNED